jgi:2-oxoisovalerate dehydrogenase E2 component (dihydrolipoyl transacylase)
MPTKVLVPRLGEGVEEITITKWLKHEGDSVRELEPLLEVNTDKVDTEIPSPASGTLLKIEMQEGQPAHVGEVLALISTEAETETGPGPGAEKPARENKPAKPDSPRRTKADPVPPSAVHPNTPRAGGPPSTTNHELGFISPLVARIAAENGINLQRVKGSGLGGRITKEDILTFVESGKSVKGEIGKLADRETGEPTSQPAINLPGTDSLIEHTVIRKQIARHMLASKQTSPHVLTVMEADMSNIVAHQNAYKEIFAREGIHLTYTVYFIAALAAGLKSFPLVNSSWSEQGILVHSAINIGMATSLGEEGLIVPVIKHADGISLPDLARAANDLAARARAKKLQPDEVQGGTFTLTNHGTSGSLLAMPIIHQPECGILGTGAVQKRAVVINDAIAIRPMVYLSFVFDHRILDGASADRFLANIKERLENWL